MKPILLKKDVLDMDFSSLTKRDLFSVLKTHEKGLSTQDASQRLDEFGLNKLSKTKNHSPIALFLHEFTSPLVLILLAAVAFSIVTKQWLDATMVSIILVFSAFLSFIQEYRATLHLDSILAKTQLNSQVLRDGKLVTLPTINCVPGDIVFLAAGSLVPADGTVLEATHCFVNQASLTGESLPVEKHKGTLKPNTALIDQDSRVFLGTNIQSGSAWVCLTQTGLHSEMGQLTQHLQSDAPLSDFEKGLNQFSTMLSKLILILVIAVFLINLSLQKPMLDSLLFAIALAVGIAPELLPAILNVTLAQGAQSMAKKGVLVRRLNSIENMGSMDILCTDKTGTITHGNVILKQHLNALGDHDLSIAKQAYLNASLQSGVRNPMDEAIMTLDLKGLESIQKRSELPYDFTRKCLSVIIQDSQSLRMITKGAFEPILKRCNRIKTQTIVDLNPSLRDVCLERYRDLSTQGYRVLGLATKDISEEDRLSQVTEEALCFEGFLVFEDPLKEDVLLTLTNMENKGVSVKIITGDNRYVAKHVAHQLNLADEAIVISDQLHSLTDEALSVLADRCSLFAEMDPIQKERIVRVLKTKHVVGYMGDGINDAPSLRIADVGISVDNAVDVAKEAADFVLLKQDLNLVYQGIMEGRRIFSNTLKYVLMTISANFGNMISMALASLILPFLPLLAKQILLNNVLSDIPAIGMPNDRVDDDLIEQPHRWDIKSIQRFMIIFGCASSFFDVLTFGLLIVVFHSSELQFQSAWFMESLFTELIIVFVIRTQKPFYTSRPGKVLVWLTVLTSLVAFIMPYTILGKAFSFSPLSATVWLTLVGVLILYIVTVEYLKKWYFHSASKS